MKHVNKVEVGCIVHIFNTFNHFAIRIIENGNPDPFSNVVTVDSPLGRALLGKTPYDIVQVKTRKFKNTYIIKEILCDSPSTFDMPSIRRTTKNI